MAANLSEESAWNWHWLRPRLAPQSNVGACRIGQRARSCWRGRSSTAGQVRPRRQLLEQGHNLDRLLIVHLQGADLDMMRAPLGAVAATPLVNAAAPVKQPMRCIYNRDRRHG